MVFWYQNDERQHKELLVKSTAQSVGVVQLTLDGREIARYVSYRAAQYATWVLDSVISRTARGKRKVQHATDLYNWKLI